MQLKKVCTVLMLLFIISAVAIGYFNTKIHDPRLLNSLAQFTGVVLLGNAALTAPSKALKYAWLVLMFLAVYVLAIKDLNGIRAMTGADYINPVFAILVFIYLIKKK